MADDTTSDMADDQAAGLDRVRPTLKIGSQTAADLLRKQLPPVRFVVPAYIPEGLTVLAGRPKLGKSWFALGTALAVATGQPVLGSIQVEQGDVLYLALEDNERRLQQRLRQMLLSGITPRTLYIDTHCPRLDNGGLEAIEGWIDSVENPRLIIIDVFGKIRPERSNIDTLYEADYRALAPLKQLADARGIGILVVHHVRKMAAEDPFDTVSGSTGFTGAADTVLILDRSGQGTTLYGRGRDIEEIETALSFDRTTGLWTAIGPASQARRSNERQAILLALGMADQPLSPKEIADALEMPGANVRQLLRKMAAVGEVVAVSKGRYACPDTEMATVQAGNIDHTVTDDCDDL